MKATLTLAMLLSAGVAFAAQAPAAAPETPQYRPAYHFTPAAHWMNDPNGMVFHDGVYHLFFQYYPDGMVWGPMHWGHATSRDLLRWTEHDIALRPDAHGMIFSGSAVVDEANSSGFGRDGRAPLVAIFTHHDADAERAGSQTFQTQSLAYSLDDGKSWTKYDGNPVLRNPGIRDFRDPKVFWHAASARWVMSLAARDRIAFYSSPNLREWKRESDFGADAGSHVGTWECPDLFPLTIDGRTRWVLLVSVDKGGPNGGSATQYFIGDFDGHRFTADETQTRWVDHGADDYAGVTWSNTGERRIFLGWMSNWAYAKEVPTSPWRSAMTLPRELRLQRVGDGLALASTPAVDAATFGAAPVALPTTLRDGSLSLDEALRDANGAFALRLRTQELRGFTLALGNDGGDALELGYDEAARAWFIDRSRAGLSDFNPGFARRHVAPRIATDKASDVVLYFDATSVELFADGGLSVMTSLFFPQRPYTTMTLRADDGLVLERLEVQRWRKDRAAVGGD